MLSYNILFGGGAPLRSRAIFTGPDRRVPSYVTARIRPYKLRSKTSPASVEAYSIAHNGAVYMLVPTRPTSNPPFPVDYYTGTDTATLTVRSGDRTQFRRVTALGSVFLAEGSADGGNARVYRSTDNGASWPMYWDYVKNIQVAGGKAFWAAARTDQAMSVYNASTSAWDTRGLPEAPLGAWMGVAHNGTVYCVASPSRAAVSTDAVSFSVSTGFAAVAAALPFPVSRLYTFGSRFIAVGFSAKQIVAMVSEDGHLWSQTAAYPLLDATSARTIYAMSFMGADLDGVLYIGISYLESGKYITGLISTADGKDWQMFPDIIPATGTFTAPPELFVRPGTSTIMLGGTLVDTDETGVELFYEL